MSDRCVPVPEPCPCPANPHRQGTLFLVVGPSGAGKDTLIDGAKAVLEPCPRFVFPRRFITRPMEAGGEVHEAVTQARFDALAERGAFCLSWSAHDLRYAVPSTIAGQLAEGRHVVVNVSRKVLETARAGFTRMRIILVTADRAVLTERLAARGRESAEDIAARLSRADALPVEGADVSTIRNEGAIDDGVAQFLHVLAAAETGCRVLSHAREPHLS